jgi:hypothetical protein
MLVLTAGIALALSGAIPLVNHILADTKPALQINFEAAQPREVEDSTQQAIVRDYSAAWKALKISLANNTTGSLADNFTGFALDRLSQRVKDQQQNGITTRLIDRGHKVEAVFYSPDGSSMELKDTATIETQVLDGSTILHSDRAQIHYYAVLTGAEDRWKVRVLESAE